MSHGLHGVGGSVFIFGVGGVVPGRGVRVARSDARATICFLGSNEGGGRAEDGVEAVVDVGFDVDGVRGCSGVD